MKSILIISYHSLPMDAIASYRAMAYLKHFYAQGINPTLLTHHWGADINMDVATTTKNKDSTGITIRIPIKKHQSISLVKKLESFPIINKISIILRWLSGRLDPNPLDQNSYLSLKKYCFKHFEETNYDLIIGISSPHHHHKLCYELHQKFDVPYVLDYRDLWNNRIIHKQYKPNLTELIQDKITSYYWRKWLSKAMFFSITSEDWRNKISELSDTKGIIIHNGFDPELFVSTNSQSVKKNFTIVHGGTLYSHQKLDIFLLGCKKFIREAKPNNFQVKFIGGDRSNPLTNQLSGFMHESKKYVHSSLEEKYCTVTKRIPKEKLALEISSSQLLLFPSFPDSPGTYAGKIFDMIASNKNILMIPDDNSVVAELIRKTNTGYICNTEEEVYLQLVKSYQEWLEHGELAYQGRSEIINHYSRENQVRKMAAAIHEALEDKGN